MTQQLKAIIERVKTWPEWRQEDDDGRERNKNLSTL
jgi:hypothetical protein